MTTLPLRNVWMFVTSMLASGPRPTPVHRYRAITRHQRLRSSPPFHRCPRYRVAARITATASPAEMRSGLRPFFDGPHDDVWIVGLPKPSTSPAVHASRMARTTSTFSCDIAYSESPAVSRASARVEYMSNVITFRSRTPRTNQNVPVTGHRCRHRVLPVRLARSPDRQHR